MKMVKNKLASKLGVGFVLFVMVMSVFSGAVSATDMDTNSIDSGINATSVVQNDRFAYSERSVADTIKTPKKGRDKIGVLSYSSQTLSNGIISMTLDNYGHSNTFYYPDDGQSSHQHMYNYKTFIRYNDSTQSFTRFSVKKPITLTRGYGYNYTNSIISDGNLDINITATLFDNKHYILFKYDLLNVTTYLKNVSIYQGADLDMEGSGGGEVGYYDSVNDILFENQTRNIGFGSDNQSDAHDLSHYNSMWTHITSDTLNNDTMYPTSGTADVGIALKWNLGDLSVGTGKTLHIALAAADSYVVMAQNLQEALKKEFVSIGVSKGLYESEYTPGDYSGTVYDLTTLPEKQIKVVIKISNPTPDKFNVSLSDSFPDEFVFAEELNTTPNFILTENKVCWNFTLDGNSNYAYTYYLTIGQPGDYWLGTAKLVERNEEFSFSSVNVQVHIIKLISDALVPRDLTPANNTHTGATEVLFSWRTLVNSSSEVFIKGEGENNYTLLIGDPGLSHIVAIDGLIRNTWYDFYARSNSTHGSATSEVRRIFIDNGIIFSRRNYEFTIERDYNQERTITIINTDDEPHEVLLNVSGVPEDLALNFVGVGSMDQVIALHPGESKDVAIVIHAQDALAEEYTILFNLTNLGAEVIRDFAYLKLHVHFPVIDYTIEETDSDPHTLAKTIRVSNMGDPLTDLAISASDELSSMVMFQPSIDHAYLGTGESIEFEAIPVLSEGFTGASGTINVSAAGEEQNLYVDFSCSDGKQIFVGHYPNLTINYNEEFENDDLIYTNPPDGAVVDSYEIEGDKMFGIYVAVDVRQGEEPIYDAEVQLRVWTPENETVFSGISDAYGTAIFAVHRPIGCYSYKAELVGYGAVTETRSFTASDEPKFTALLEGIQWMSVSDADSTFDLTAEIPEEIELDSTPFSFTATVDQPLEEGAVAVLSLRPDIEDVPDEALALIRSSFFVDIKGTVKDNTLSFSTELVPQGTYTAAIAVYHPTEVRVPIFPMALSLPITINITEDYLDKPLNFHCQRTVALEAGQYAVMNIEQKAEVVDPHKVINLDFIEAGESEYLFRYYALADQTMDDTIIIEVKNGSDEVILHEIMPVHLEANVMEYIEFSVPIYDEAGNLIEGYNVTVTAADPVVTLTVITIAWFAGGVGLSVADRYYPEVGVVKCGVGLANPITGLGSAVTDIGFGAYDWIVQKGNAARDAAGTYGALTGIAAGKADAVKVGHKIVKGTAKSFKLPGKGMGTAFCVFGCAVETYEIYEKYSNDKGDKAGAHITQNSHVRNCINHAPLRTTVRTTSDLDFLCSPVQNVEGIFVTAYFPREVPASYQPFDTIIMLNGHEIGRIEDAVPKGYYTFEADPTWLNYADAGVAENTITLDVEGMNRGYYVPLEGYKIDILFKKLTRAVCVASQAEADQIVMDLGSAMDHRADFAVGPADIKFSDLQPSEGEAVTIEATIHNLGSEGEIQVDVQFIDNGVEIGSVCAPYLPEFSSETVSVNWTATGGTHNIQLNVNPDREINELDYTNNEASKTISVTAPDATKPVISNPQPPDGSIISDNTPLISADLADPGSGINTTAVRITLDEFDVTQNATVISSRVWYTPEIALANGVHNVSVYAEDNKGNNNSLDWSFTAATEKQPPVASFTYSPLNPTVNETILFNASNSYDPDGFIVNYEWDFGDDIAAAGEIVEHSYSKPGDYIVILRVTNNASLSNTNTRILTVTMVEAAICGDVTGDNKVTMGDARRIEMWLLYPEDYPINNLWAADVTGDGEVTGDDARRIIMWLSDPEQYPLACSTP